MFGGYNISLFDDIDNILGLADPKPDSASAAHDDDEVDIAHVNASEGTTNSERDKVLHGEIITNAMVFHEEVK